MCTCITWGSCWNADSDSVGLGWDLRVSISNKLPDWNCCCCWSVDHTLNSKDLEFFSIVNVVSFAPAIIFPFSFLIVYNCSFLHLSLNSLLSSIFFGILFLVVFFLISGNKLAGFYFHFLPVLWIINSYFYWYSSLCLITLSLFLLLFCVPSGWIPSLFLCCLMMKTLQWKTLLPQAWLHATRTATNIFQTVSM